MPVSLEFLRGMLGVLCIFFAHMAGRSAAFVRKGRQKVSKLYGWILRTVVCAVVIVFRSAIDPMVIGIWAVALVAFLLGLWVASRQKTAEPGVQIFPE